MKQDNEKETDNTEPAVTYHVACHGENSRIRAWWLRQAGKSKVEQDKSRHQGEKKSKAQSRKLEEHSPCGFVQAQTMEKILLISMTGHRKSLIKNSGSEILGSNLLKVTVGVWRSAFHLECEPGNFYPGICRNSLRLRLARNQ